MSYEYKIRAILVVLHNAFITFVSLWRSGNEL